LSVVLISVTVVVSASRERENPLFLGETIVIQQLHCVSAVTVILVVIRDISSKARAIGGELE
jgi:hypothetical protein